MKNAKTKNEQMKRKYFKLLTGAKGFIDATIEVIEKALWDYEEFSCDEDYALFNEKKAREFKKWLAIKKHRNTTMSLSTQYTRLTKLIKFFEWLSQQNGYKSRISTDDISYLQMSKKEAKVATSPKVDSLEYPTLEQVKHLSNKIEPKTEIDLRDKALIAFTLLSGMRDNAIITLPLGCFDSEKLFINQDPSKGVRTKFSKTIPSFIFKFDKDLLNTILYWHSYLIKEKKFNLNDPFFPRTRISQISNTNYAFQADGVEPIYWKSAGSMRHIIKDRCKKANLKYFPPHKFRHATTRLAIDRCKNAEQMKAVSQNLGHESVSTTLLVYGRLAPDQIGRVITSMNFDKEELDTDKKLKEIMRIMQN